MQWWFKYPELMRRSFNLWPPFWLTGIKVEKVAPDYSYARVKLKWRPWTRNLNGSQFGGSLFSMTDPIYTTLLLARLGIKRYYVWDQAAEIVFKKPAYGAVWFEAEVSDAFIEDIRQQTASGEKYLPKVVNRLVNKNGDLIAEVNRTLYVRLRPAFRPKQ
ncbi:DUF4442 domain-containing protein [Suttonella ornithocola]|nr:DUF4442 domain-containing protein [Suttonella ornithocola]